MARDIIINVYSQPSDQRLKAAGLNWKASDVQPLHKFDSTPLRIGVSPTPGMPAWQGFVDVAAKAKARGNGSIIRGLVQQQFPDVQPRRIAFTAFSAGNSFLRRVLEQKIDADLLDTVISLDGMTYAKGWDGKPVPESFAPWENFARRATGVLNPGAMGNPYLSPLMVCARTDVAALKPASGPGSSSTGEAAQYLFATLNNLYWTKLHATHGGLQAFKASADYRDQERRQNEIKGRLFQSFQQMVPFTITCGAAPHTQTKTWAHLEPNIGYLGNLWSLNFGGTGPADHCMIAYAAQRAIFDAFLVPRWNSRDQAVAGLSGLGATPEEVQGEAVTWTTPGTAKPGGGIVRRDVLAPTPFAVGAKMVGGLAAAYLAFMLGRRLTAGARR